jgi:hypothetical protein
MVTLEIVYTMVNKETGATITCAKDYIIVWLARGFEVESFTSNELLKEGPVQASPIMYRKATPHLSSNNVEYFSSLNSPKKKM